MLEDLTDLTAAQILLGGRHLGRPERLVSSDRAAVYRAAADSAEHPSVIVKRYAGAGEGWARETAALHVLGGLDVPAPALLAASADPPLVVTADAGAGPSLAAALLGDDPQRAAALLEAWAVATAAVHAGTRGARGAFAAELAGRAAAAAGTQDPPPVHDTRMGTDIEDCVRVLDRVCASLGVPVPAGALDELRDLNHRLGPDTDLAALTPADACPDDAVTDDAGTLVLVDYENAQWRHVAWDVAYLRVPWPTCWCSWRLPAAVTDAAVAAYRRAAAPAFPAVGDDAFVRDLDAATVGWALMSATLFLDAALGEDRPLSGRYADGPPRRPMILHRLERASRLAVLPAAGELAAALLADLRARWGDDARTPLELAPAFR